MTDPTGEVPLRPDDAATRHLVARVLRALQGIRFGSVEIVIHDSRVVHIERREKLRLDEGVRETQVR